MFDDEKVIDERRLTAMKIGIISLEKDNLKTNERTNEEMVDTIRKIIVSEIKKNY